MKKNLYTIDFFFHSGLWKKSQFSHSCNTLSQKQHKGSKLFWQGQAPRLSLAWSRILQPPVNPLHLKRPELGLASPSIASSWESKWQRTEIPCSSGLLFEHLKQQYTAMASGPAVRTTAAVQHHTAHCWPGSCQGIKWETGKLFGVGWVQLVWPFFLKGR